MDIGGSSGIGKATAIKFINEGWNVVVSARNLINLNNLKSEINEKYTLNKIYVFKCDIRNLEEVKQTVLNIEQIGPIDTVILNAGTTTLIVKILISNTLIMSLEQIFLEH